MKKKILATIMMVLFIGTTGCGQAVPIPLEDDRIPQEKNDFQTPQENILSVMEKKYGKEFEFDGWAHKAYGSQDMIANLTCSSFPGERIHAGQEVDEDGDITYFDDYMAYQDEDEIQEILEDSVQKIYPNARVIWKINSSEFPREMSQDMSIEEIVENKESVFSTYIVVNQGVFESSKNLDLENLRKELEEKKIRMSGALFFTLDETAYQTVNGDNYSYWASKDDWFEQRCNFATNREYGFIYADWRKAEKSAEPATEPVDDILF